MFAQLQGHLSSLMILTGALVAGIVLNRIAMAVLRRAGRALSWDDLQVLVKHLHGPLSSLLPAFCVSASRPFMQLGASGHTVAAQVLGLWTIASLGWLCIEGVHVTRDIILGRFDIHAKDNLHARQVYTRIRLIANVIKTVIVVLTIAFLLMTFPKVQQIGVGILASAGVMGIVLGFAAQKTLGNFIAGIQIALAQPIRLNDVVIVGSEWGEIEDISLTFVVVKTWDLRRLIVPISYFLENPFQNWTRVSANLLGTVFIYADYTLPVDDLRREFERIVTTSPLWDHKAQSLQVTDLKEGTVQLRALVSAADSGASWDLCCEVREKLLGFIQKNYPQCLPRTRLVLERSSDNRPQQAGERSERSDGARNS